MNECLEWASTKGSHLICHHHTRTLSRACVVASPELRSVRTKPVNRENSVMRSGELDSVAVRGAEAAEGLGGGGRHSVLADFPRS